MDEMMSLDRISGNGTDLTGYVDPPISKKRVHETSDAGAAKPSKNKMKKARRQEDLSASTPDNNAAPKDLDNKAQYVKTLLHLYLP